MNWSGLKPRSEQPTLRGMSLLRSASHKQFASCKLPQRRTMTEPLRMMAGVKFLRPPQLRRPVSSVAVVSSALRAAPVVNGAGQVKQAVKLARVRVLVVLLCREREVVC